MIEVFPFAPRDWVADASGRVAKVRSVYEGSPDEVLLDLTLYSDRGDKIGRESPPCGGPRTFEPACSAEFWHRISKPVFPIPFKWVPNEQGTSFVAKRVAGEKLPPAKWQPKPRKFTPRPPSDESELRQALQMIADGHNDARSLALSVLRRSDLTKSSGPTVAP